MSFLQTSFSAHAAAATPGSLKPSRAASRPSGFDPLRTINVSLAGGTRSRAPPSLHAGVAITVPRSGALLNRSPDCSRLGSRDHFMPASLSLPLRRLPFLPCCSLVAAPAILYFFSGPLDEGRKIPFPTPEAPRFAYGCNRYLDIRNKKCAHTVRLGATVLVRDCLVTKFGFGPR